MPLNDIFLVHLPSALSYLRRDGVFLLYFFFVRCSVENGFLPLVRFNRLLMSCRRCTMKTQAVDAICADLHTYHTPFNGHEKIILMERNECIYVWHAHIQMCVCVLKSKQMVICWHLLCTVHGLRWVIILFSPFLSEFPL